MEAVESAEPRPSGTARGMAGALGAGAALGAGELVAGLIEPLPSLVGGVAALVIDTVPEPIERFAIAVFGLYDKLALGVGMILVSLILGFMLGRRWDRRAMSAVFAVFGLLAALAASRSPQADLTPALLNGVISAGAGIVVHRTLLRAAPRAEDPGRRAFLTASLTVAGAAVVAGIGGRMLIDRARHLAARRSEVVLPLAREPVAPPPPDSSLGVTGISSLITPNPEFYRIDTAAFSVPRVDLASWTLTVNGSVRRELTLDFADLLGLPMVERYITLACVSNQVGGELVGNAKWLGVPLHTVLDRAGLGPHAEQVVGRSVDGFTVGFPVEAAYDGRDALIAVGMNDEPLPLEHGFPARLVVAGLYGYVSATKWLAEIELTTWDGFDAYWVPRGWAKEAPIKTQSRIDVPRNGATVSPGPVAIAGVAWAPTRGIATVEVQVDEGPWREARLGVSLSSDAWRQWSLDWEASPGLHTIQVRATDGLGVTQTAERSAPPPDGATGWHTIIVSVA